jgi:hypothetical protein
LDEILVVREGQKVLGDQEGGLGRVGSCRKAQEVGGHVREEDHFHGREDRKVFDHRSRGLGDQRAFFRQDRVVEGLTDVVHLAPCQVGDWHFGDGADVVEGACLKASEIVFLPQFQGASLARGRRG